MIQVSLCCGANELTIAHHRLKNKVGKNHNCCLLVAHTISANRVDLPMKCTFGPALDTFDRKL